MHVQRFWVVLFETGVNWSCTLCKWNGIQIKNSIMPGSWFCWALGHFNLPLAPFPCLCYVLSLLLLPRLTLGCEVMLAEFVKHMAVPSKLLVKTWGILLRAFQKSTWASQTGSPLPFATLTTSINNSVFHRLLQNWDYWSTEHVRGEFQSFVQTPLFMFHLLSTWILVYKADF